MSRQDVLVTADWAEKNLGTDGIVFVEVDEDTTAYDGGHLPGAVKINWTTELQDPVRRDIVTKEQFEQLLSAKGVSNDDRVVLYGGKKNWWAAYAYWIFKLYNHADVRIMNGGRAKWEAEGRPLVRDVPQYPPTEYKAQEADLSIRAFRDQVLEHIQSGNPLVDVRSPDEYTGKVIHMANYPQEGAQRAGHVPTAQNIPWATAANPDGTFKSAAELREIYGGRGITPDKPVIAYCRIGERSAHTWFVLTQLLGYPDVRNYDGSWTEWGSLVRAPIAKGEEPGSLKD